MCSPEVFITYLSKKKNITSGSDSDYFHSSFPLISKVGNIDIIFP